MITVYQPLSSLDAFYTQVERKRHPELAEKAIAVVQWSGLIAVDYRCKQHGVGRFCSIEQAKELLPDIAFVHVDVVNGKVSLRLAICMVHTIA